MTSITADRVKGVRTSLAIKVPCLTATTANITLSGAQTVGGVAVTDGDRVLVWSQTNKVENGIWTASTGAWSRAPDCNGINDITYGTRVPIMEGTHAGRWFHVSTSSASITVGTDQVEFSYEAFSPAPITTRTALKSLDTSTYTYVYITEAGREGHFQWKTGDYSTHVGYDTCEGWFIPANGVASTVGCWVRTGETRLNIKHFGALGDGTTSDRDSIQCAIDVATRLSDTPNVVYIPASTTNYRMLGDDAVLTAYGDLVLEGDGMFISVVERDDFTANSGGRRDFLKTDALGAYDLTFRDFQILGEWEKAYTPAGGSTYTVNYRTPGDIQLEGYCRDTASSTSEIYLPDTAVATDGYYVGADIQIGSGTGAGTDTEITGYTGATRLATLATVVIGGTPAQVDDTYIQIGAHGTPGALTSYANGFGMNLDDAGDIVCERVMFRGIRNQAFSIDNANSVLVQGCHLYKCARGGISLRRCPDVIVQGNMLRYVGDDAIFNSHVGTAGSPGESVNTLITGNVLIDTVGIRAFGAHKMTVTDNLLIRCTIKGIGIGPVDNGVASHMHAINVSGNTILDPVDRNAVAYGFASAERAVGIEIYTGTGVFPSETGSKQLEIPGQERTDSAGNITLPDTFIVNTASLMPGQLIQVQNNIIASLWKIGSDFSDYNGDGIFYHRGTLLTDGFIDRAIALDDISYYPIKFAGPLHGAKISGNLIMGRGPYPGIGFLGDETTGSGGLSSDIMFDNAITKTTVDNNMIWRCDPAILIEDDGATTKSLDIDINNNDFDCDPYFEHSTRKTGPIDGTWTGGSAALWVVDNLRTDGIKFRNNVIRNTAAIRRRAFAYEDGNTIYARIAAANFSNSNGGVATLPTSPGYRVIDTDCDPLSATYMEHVAPILEASAMPTTGRHMVGTFVRNSAPAIQTDGSYVVGWTRLTTGSGNVDQTDWAQLRAFSDGAQAAGTIAYNDISVVSGTKPTAGSDAFGYYWSRTGERVMVVIRLDFGNSDTFSNIEIPFTAIGSLPSPKEPSGITTGVVQSLFPVSVNFSATDASNPSANARGDVYKNASNAYLVRGICTSSAYQFVSWRFEYIAA